MSGGTATKRIASHPFLGDDPRDTRVKITFDGEPLVAFAGETISAALLANGISVGRTLPETDSPRGYFCGTGRCPDCSLTVDGELNVRACVTPVRAGMQIETQLGFGIWKARHG